jgi:hypothetical protein
MELCIFPRLRMSPTDAVFSAQFLRLIHGLGTPNFSSLTMYDKVRHKTSYFYIFRQRLNMGITFTVHLWRP